MLGDMDEMVAVVTGGTRGIGLGIAEALARRGASVALTYHKDHVWARKAMERLEPFLESGRKALLLQGDVGDPDVVRSHCNRVRDELGKVSVLVNNAGVMTPRSFGDIGLEEWEMTLRTNLSGAFYWTSGVVGDMEAMGFGRIVNISSIAARGGGVVGAHYAASKAALLGFTKYLAKELGPRGITVNAIAPAFIEDAGIFTSWSHQQKKALLQKVVVPRLGLVEDVVRAFEFFLDSPFVTGITLDVNGGAFMP
ncbi:MAG: SDR family NAD(P)-dependent oxidoreductase [bacterium]